MEQKNGGLILPKPPAVFFTRPYALCLEKPALNPGPADFVIYNRAGPIYI
jgi:hypothetical protein